MGVMYARVGGAWVPVISPPEAPVDEVWVGPDAPTKAETELWVDADQAPAPMLYAKIGGNWTSVSSPPTNEVAIQSAAPTGNEELWYDTDAPGYTNEDLRWMSAWGVQAVGTVGAYTVAPTVSGPITGTLNYTPVAGRRYRIVMDIRAATVSGAGSSIKFILRNSGTAFPAGTPESWAYVVGPPGSYGLLYKEWLFNGDGVAKSFQVTALTASQTLNTYDEGLSFFYVEDVGPVVGAAPATSPLIDRWNTAWGIVGMGSASSGTVPANVVTNIGSVTGPIVAGRRYKLTAKTRATATSPPAGANLRWAGQDVTANDTWAWVGGNYQSLNHDLIFTASTTGTYTWTLAASCAATGWYLYFDYQCSFVTLEDLGPVATAVPIADPTPAWQTIYGQNGWGNYGGGFQVAQYRKIGDIVTMRGLVSGGTIGSVIFNLPVGYRPPAIHIFPTDTQSNSHGRIDVRPDGDVVALAGNPAYFSVSGPSWSVSA